MKNQTTYYIQLLIKIVIGVIFSISAILKLISIDKFEIYIFSYQFFNLYLSFFVARLIIITELFIGVGFLLNVCNKFFNILYIIVLLSFTGFLIYATSIGRGDNCHCFGELMNLNPLHSIIKNIILILLIIPIRNIKPFKIKKEILIIFITAVASALTVFIISPPDNIYNIFNKNPKNLNREEFSNIIRDSAALAPLNKGVKIVGIYSTECEYCKITSEKIAFLSKYYSIPNETIFNIFWGASSEQTIKDFYKSTFSPSYSYSIIDLLTFMKMTNGVMPIVLIVKDGVVINEFTYRDIDQNEIKGLINEL